MNKLKRRKYAGVIPLTVFLLVWGYAVYTNYSFEFNDSDDAYTMRYHMLGRDQSVQFPYSAYDSMCDKILSYLPQNYYILYNTMILSTLFFTIILAAEITFIIKIKLLIKNKNILCFIPLFLILISPEIIYLSLTFKSSVIGFSFVLLSHIIIISKLEYFKRKFFITLIISSIVFAFGVSLRWNTVTYALVILYEIIKRNDFKNYKAALKDIMVWGISGFVFIILFLNLSGYSIIDLIETGLWGMEYSEGISQKIQFSSVALGLSTFITPAFILLFSAGLFMILKRKEYDILTYLILSFAPFIFINPYFPKDFLQAFPVLFLIAGYPLIKVSSVKARKALTAAVVLLIGVNWFTGIKIEAENVFYGPGYSFNKNEEFSNSSETNLDQRVKINKIYADLSDGFCFPTQEGDRPLFGHFYVLFCNKYRDKLISSNRSYQSVIDFCKSGIPVLTDRENLLLENKLIFNGYKTKDVWLVKNTDRRIPRLRTYYKSDADNDKIRIYKFAETKRLFDKELLRESFKNNLFTASFSSSSMLNQFLNRNKEFILKIYKIDPYNCLIYIN